METKYIQTDETLFIHLTCLTGSDSLHLYLNKDIAFFKRIEIDFNSDKATFSWKAFFNPQLTTKSGYIFPSSRNSFSTDSTGVFKEEFKTLRGTINNLKRCLKQAPWLFLPELIDSPQCFRLKHNLWVYELPFKFRKILILKNHPINLVQIKAVHDSNYSIIEYRGIKFEIEKKKLLKNLQ